MKKIVLTFNSGRELTIAEDEDFDFHHWAKNVVKNNWLVYDNLVLNINEMEQICLIECD